MNRATPQYCKLVTVESKSVIWRAISSIAALQDCIAVSNSGQLFFCQCCTNDRDTMRSSQMLKQ